MKIYEDIKSELKGYNIESVAENSGVAPATIYFWLNGTTKKPRLDTVVRVAKAIGYELQLVKVSGKYKLKVAA